MPIEFINPYNGHLLTLSDDGLKENDRIIFPKINGAYKVVDNNNYTNNFGFQWNKFSETQMNLDISKKRFFAETNFDKENLTGKNVLEAGCGAGRFSKIVLEHTEAELYSVDYSNAVEANFKNNGPHTRLKLFQASIYELPFAPAQFDKVFCFGVLQHTPDPERSIKALTEMVKPGGELIVDFYPHNGWWTMLQAKYLLRRFTKRMDHEKLYKLIDRNIAGLIKTSRLLSKFKLQSLNRFLPICDIHGTVPKNITNDQLRSLCVLDTFDMFSPKYDQPQKMKRVVSWFKKYGMEDVWAGTIFYEDHKAAVVKGIKKF